MQAPDGFTPTELRVNADGALSFCAYSGCWEGQADKILRVGKYLVAVGLSLQWSNPEGTGTDTLAAVIDTESNVATILSDMFAQPMTCTVLAGESSDR